MFVKKWVQIWFDRIQGSAEIFAMKMCRCKNKMPYPPCHTPTPIHTPRNHGGLTKNLIGPYK